ncbi:MAG: hypothetical protein OXH75_17670 [Acidobacteria bacterium]|nr:hypothetical protein [Acidobacteriota bacterium]
MTDQRNLGAGPRFIDEGRTAGAATKTGRSVVISGATYVHTGADQSEGLVLLIPDVSRGQTEDADIASGDQVRAAYVLPGQTCEARVTNTGAVAVGDPLAKIAGGILAKAGSGKNIVARAEEALEANSSDSLCLVRAVGGQDTA